jgi:hypothetical protein
MKKNSCERTGKAISCNPHAVGMAFLIGTILMLPALATPAQAFDLAGFKSRAESAAAEVSTKSLPDSKETLGRLNELIEV